MRRKRAALGAIGTEPPEEAFDGLVERGRLLNGKSDEQSALQRREDRPGIAPWLHADTQATAGAATAQGALEPSQVYAEELPDSGLYPGRKSSHLSCEDAAEATLLLIQRLTIKTGETAQPLDGVLGLGLDTVKLLRDALRIQGDELDAEVFLRREMVMYGGLADARDAREIGV